MEEVDIHSKINHKNAVKLLGYCIGESTLTMVSEYIPRGNLEDILHKVGYSITLDTILGIAIGCAEALSYMHSMHLSSDNLVCHGDIKPANILLDANLTAKVSDFGLSRLLSGGITQYTAYVKGSLDYVDPIHIQSGLLTPKSDVYSFGIVILELITRRRVKEGKFSLIEAFRKAYTKWSMLRELVDADIAKEGNMNALVEIGNLAMDCLTLNIDKRPKINDVAVRLQTLWNDLRRGRDSRHSAMLEKFSNVRMFTMEHLRQVTKGWSSRFHIYRNTVYKGTLDDNTAVVVYLTHFAKSDKEVVINTWMLQSQIVHKNIIKLLGCCLEADTPFFVYECPAKCSLSDILNGEEDFPLDLRVKIAVETADALEYLHSSAVGITAHDLVEPRNLLIDDNFMPKITSFSWVWRLAKQTGLPVNGIQIDNDEVLSKAQRDVYEFGILLLELFGRKKRYGETNLDIILQFTKAYEIDNSRMVMFHKNITVEGDITVLEEIGRLALKCAVSKAEERPKIPEVAQHLRMLIRRRWKVSMTQGATWIPAFHPKASFTFIQLP
ncbi:Wall-associated receptor kinase 2 [Dichanthelium oligosanthes]|uniref:Wall-associated receptor kinase 2 n=1 Tax=Dichanthelium oligosanthes TaxID=888268 RepID=A0A1E5UPH2_9POAL|nr:Wall-associated receptor kinase 2 [Dichanthelium oligosanthes]